MAVIEATHDAMRVRHVGEADHRISEKESRLLSHQNTRDLLADKIEQ